VGIHQRVKHPVFVEGCNPCKWATVAFFDVPGGSRESNVTAGMRQMEKNLHRYRDKKQAGEIPRSITKEGMDKGDKLQDTWSTNEKRFIDNHSSEEVDVIKKTLLNK
jgi:hypothetical protein